MLTDNNHLFTRLMYGALSIYAFLLLYILNICASSVNRETLVTHKLLCKLVIKLNYYKELKFFHNLKVCI